MLILTQKGLKNIERKGENTGYQPFLLSPQFHKKLHCNGCLNSGLYGKGLRSQTVPPLTCIESQLLNFQNLLLEINMNLLQVFECA